MARRLKPLEQRISALGLAVLCLALAYFLLVHWWFTEPLLALDEESYTLQQAYQHYEGLVAQRGALEQQAAKAAAEESTAESLLNGPDSGAGGAQLMGIFASYVQEASIGKDGCVVSNRMPITSRSDSAFVPVKISVNIECGVEPLARLLYKIESGRPYLFVESLNVRNSSSSVPGESRRRLSVQMLVSGYLRNSAASGTAP